MSRFSRRDFIKTAGAAGALSGLGLGLSACAQTPAKGAESRVVVIGGGYGGAVAAKYIKMMDPTIGVTLVEPNKTFYSCPMSNWVLGGFKEMKWLGHSYETLRNKRGIKVVHDWATSIDPVAQKVSLKNGNPISYDRLIVSPGVSFRYESIEGYDEAAAELAPHAWHAGPQTALLRKQLEAMPNGGTVIIAAPPNPFRCPPGPYERASLIAYYLQQEKPKSKIIILDAKDKFSKFGLFTGAWKELYGYGTDNSLIEWVSKANDGAVLQVDAKKRVVTTEFDDHKADVLNVIPAQKAGWIAEKSGLTDGSGWCPVNHKTWESTIHKNIHVVGDAAIQAPLPKSGYAANSEAKVCAAAVVDLLNGREPGTPSWVNTCYSLAAPDYGVSVAMVYNLTPEGKVGKVKGSGGLSPKGGNRAAEAIYAESWYDNIMDDTFG